MSPLDYARWEIFDQIEGLPTERLIRMLARFTGAICNCLGATGMTPEILLKEKKSKVKRQSAAAIKANRQRLVAAYQAGQN